MSKEKSSKCEACPFKENCNAESCEEYVEDMMLKDNANHLAMGNYD